MSSDPGQGYPGGPVPGPGQPYGQQPHYGPPSGPIPGQQPYPGQPGAGVRPQPQPGRYGAPQAPPPGNKRKLGRMFGFGIPAVVVIAVVVVLVVQFTGNSSGGDAAGQKDLGSGSQTDPAQAGVYWPAGQVKQYPAAPQGFTPGASPTDAAVAAVDPRQLYWSMLKNQSTKTITDYTHQQWKTPAEYQENYPEDVNTNRVAIDYASRNFIDEHAAIHKNGSVDGEVFRCVDKVSRYYSDFTHAWKPPEADDHDSCARRMQPGQVVYNSFTSDGVATGGLTPEEADKFVSYLDGVTGLFTMGKPVKAQGKDGRTYLQLDVTIAPLNPVKPGLEKDFKATTDNKFGVGFLNAAFRQTGKKPDDYPYSIDIAAIQGRQMRYFIDPATVLPAFSVTKYIAPQKLDGTPDNTDNGNADNGYALYAYSFPQALEPAAMKAEGTPTFTYHALPFDRVTFP